MTKHTSSPRQRAQQQAQSKQTTAPTNTLTVLLIISAVAVFAILAYVAYAQTRDSTTQGSNSISTNEAGQRGAEQARIVDGVQRVTLRYGSSGYILEPSTLIVNVPVELDVDLTTVQGCMRDIVISAFNVRKYVSFGDSIITFTPTKTGTFSIACSMNMGRGTFTVIAAADAGNTVSTTAAGATTQRQTLENAATRASTGSGGSCHTGSGGGCGCGGRAV